jgi:hypothetical protein
MWAIRQDALCTQTWTATGQGDDVAGTRVTDSRSKRLARAEQHADELC